MWLNPLVARGRPAGTSKAPKFESKPTLVAGKWHRCVPMGDAFVALIYYVAAAACAAVVCSADRSHSACEPFVLSADQSFVPLCMLI